MPWLYEGSMLYRRLIGEFDTLIHIIPVHDIHVKNSVHILSLMFDIVKPLALSCLYNYVDWTCLSSIMSTGRVCQVLCRLDVSVQYIVLSLSHQSLGKEALRW